MYAQFFGNYLLSKEVVTKEQLLQAMQKMSSEHFKIGTLAIHAGYMTASEVDEIVILQTHEDKRFGELAVSEGYMTEAQVAELLRQQSPDFLLLGQILVDNGILTNSELQDLMIDYQSMNELYDLDYSDEAKENILHLLQKFVLVTERTLSEYEFSFLQLLFNNLIRFIGDDFTLVGPSACREYPTNYCVSQKIVGNLTINTYLDMTEDACVAFASRYAGEDFPDFDEYVQAAVEDFLNLHNGLFNVNISNEYSVELDLNPPTSETTALLSFSNEAYLFPVIYPFGTIYFIFEISSNS